MVAASSFPCLSFCHTKANEELAASFFFLPLFRYFRLKFAPMGDLPLDMSTLYVYNVYRSTT
jgi:hypothetical protein